MAWTPLPTDYTDAVWDGFRKYTQIDNEDGTVSFRDDTTYTNKEKSFFGAKDANDITSAINGIVEDITELDDVKADKTSLEELKTAVDAAQNILIAMFGALPSTTLMDNTPEVIQKVAQFGMGANLWSVGDCVSIPLNGTVGLMSFEDRYTTKYAYIIGFNHNSALEGRNSIHFQFGKALSAPEKDYTFVDENYGSGSTASEGFIMNTDTYANWSGSYMRNTICPALFNAMPEAWQNVVADCTKYTSYADDIVSTSDKIWLLAEYEVFGEITQANDIEKDYQQQYEYYSNGGEKIKYDLNLPSQDCSWWLRSVAKSWSGGMCFCYVTNNGECAELPPPASLGFSPCFAVA